MHKHKQYPLRFPRHADGIRAQEVRANGGRSWWSVEWMRHLESMGMKARLGRGKNYALSGQVTSLVIEAVPPENCRVVATVLGARPDPYTVTLDFRQLKSAARSRIIASLRADPMLVARLLAGDLPLEVARLFRAEGFDLFPGGKLGPRQYDVTTACSCPDYANPCKHTAAVLVLLGEEIDREPLRLLEFRGITLKDICDED